MKKLMFLLFVLISFSAHSQGLKNSGVIFNVGKGNVSYDLPQTIEGVPSTVDYGNSYLNSKLALELGYRFRLQPVKSRFFYDVELLMGYNRMEYAVNYMPMGDTAYGGSSGEQNNYSFSVAGAVNYTIVKGLNVGIGVQPTYNFHQAQFFDAPVFAKVGYDFKCVELALSYKQGLTKSYKVTPFQNSRLSQWAFSVYVPLFGKK